MAYLGVVLSGIAAVIGAIVGWKALTVKRTADNRAAKVEAAQVGITALESALDRVETECARLRGELATVKSDYAAALAEQKAECRKVVERLSTQVRELGGIPQGGML